MQHSLSNQPNVGFVELTAYYRLNGVMTCWHKNSRFILEEGAWYYVGNALYRVTGSEAHKIKKVARNAPCPCGSGKPYKKCCYA
jgi:SEC-C motif domain protein